MADKKWHKKISEARGEKWKANVREGRKDAVVNPSNIRLYRMKRRVDQRDIVKTLEKTLEKKVTDATFGQIERGKRMVKRPMAEAIAGALNAPLTKLFNSAGRNKYVAIIQKSLV